MRNPTWLRPLPLLAGLLGLALFAPAANARPKIHIALAGDSTVSNFPASNPKRGWGQLFAENFDRQVVIDNFAKSGRSTKTFLSQGWWQKLLASKPNYVLIQFGHNDSHAPDRPEHTDPDGLYTELLRKFVAEARAIGATPVLVTPVQRRTRTDTLLPYVAAMKRVAADTHTPLIDLHQLSGELYARLGPAATARLQDTPSDLTHFNAEGARQIGRLVAGALAQAVPALRPHILTHRDNGSSTTYNQAVPALRPHILTLAHAR